MHNRISSMIYALICSIRTMNGVMMHVPDQAQDYHFLENMSQHDKSNVEDIFEL